MVLIIFEVSGSKNRERKTEVSCFAKQLKIQVLYLQPVKRKKNKDKTWILGQEPIIRNTTSLTFYNFWSKSSSNQSYKKHRLNHICSTSLSYVSGMTVPKSDNQLVFHQTFKWLLINRFVNFIISVLGIFQVISLLLPVWFYALWILNEKSLIDVYQNRYTNITLVLIFIYSFKVPSHTITKPIIQ